jgi:uncharacterized protein YkwD
MVAWCWLVLVGGLMLPTAAGGRGLGKRKHHLARHRAHLARHPVVARESSSRACAGSHLVPDAADLAAVAAATLCLVNRERASHGAPPLADDAPLDVVASAHSREMVERDYFDHVSPSGLTAAERILSAGDGSTVGLPGRGHRFRLAENIATAGGRLATPANIVASWMRSPAHRANILDPGLRASGTGVVPAMPARVGGAWRGPAGTYTQDFLGV